MKAGHDVHVAVPAEGPGAARFAARGAYVHPMELDFPARRPWAFPAIAAQLRWLVRTVQPDVIHSHFVGTTITARLALGRNHPIPRLFQVPGPLHLEHEFFRRAELATAGPGDRWIASCQWTYDCYLASGVDASRVSLSYLGTDLEEIRPHPPGSLRAELGLAPDVPVVGMVAYMYPPKRYLGQRRGLKGHEDLIDALALAAPRVPGLTGVFVGGAWNDAARYERRVRAYGRARCGDRAMFLGTRYDIPRLYADFDVAVHPSHSENLGGAAESLLLETPTVATNVGGFPDIVVPGQTGWLVPPADPRSLADAIVAALTDRDEAQRRARRGRLIASSMLDVRSTAAEVAATYEAVVPTAAAVR